jgi:murein DD-endopeptidase MepM/ murein hydrolase activator NlpD
MGRVVDPDVAEEGDLPIEQLSSEPPPIVQRRKRRAIPDEPSLRPHTHEPMPSSEDLLDLGKAPPPIPRHAPRLASPGVLSPRMTAVFGALFGLAGIIAVFAILNRVSPQSASASPKAAPPTTVASATPRPTVTRAFAGLPDFEEEGLALPGPWRVSALSEDPNVRIIQGTVGLEPFVKTLQAKGVSRGETYRILASLKQFDAMKRPRKSDKFVVAMDRSKGKVAGFELEVSALEVYQAKQNAEGLLVGTRLDMKVAMRSRKTGIRVTGGDIGSDLKQGRLRDSVIAIIDKAFDGRASMSSMPKNSTLRVIVQEKTALGRFADYDYVEALEYVSSKPDTKPLRLYRFKDGHRFGYFNQDGREPYRGGWRMPVPGAPITSHFNLKRFHPVLKKTHPHLGTDFGAPTGTPIHATSYGTIDFIGPRGPAGNLIIIKHPGNIDSYYMHMHRFASGLKKGDKVETFQVIGTVGNTGRSTGPHLHFGIKKGDQWIDPMSLQLDGDRLVTASLRADFEKVKAEFDKQLDAIELPAAMDEPDAPREPADPSEQQDPSEGATTDPGTSYVDDDELEPGSVSDEPIDDPM